MGKQKHYPVLLKEAIDMLNPKKGQIFIDVTCGFGGHAKEIAKRIGVEGKLLCLDQDPEAIAAVKKEMGRKGVIVVQENFRNLERVVSDQKFTETDGILADLGASSHQFDSAERGFSFSKEALLDMRMDKRREVSAFDIVNRYSEKDLIRIFKDYGEECLAKVIARRIVEKRLLSPITTTIELAELVEKIYHKRGLYQRIHPATKTFQALRIEVNQELESLVEFLPQAIKVLKSGGKLAIITFHSLEDKIVKSFIKENSRDCICPPDFPVCRCDHKKKLKPITRKPIVPTQEEIEKNSRSRSAKLRVMEKV